MTTTTTPVTARPPTPREAGLLDALLRPDFSGAATLRAQAGHLRVRMAFGDGTLDLLPDPATPAAAVAQRVPVEGHCVDADGGPVLVLLHVVDARLKELEIVKLDGTGVVRPPTADRLDVIVRPASGSAGL